MSNPTKNVFITGVSSGLGLGLVQYYLEQGNTVYGVSRRQPDFLMAQEQFHFQSLDLGQLEGTPNALLPFIQGIEAFDLVILNAGILGEIKDMKDHTLDELNQIMEVNVWANKVVLDCFSQANVDIAQVVTISSGASVSGNRGWGGYALSKAALNMLTKLYAREMPNTHFTAFAPGLIDTRMQDYLCTEVDDQNFASIGSIKAARDTDEMPQPKEAGQKIGQCIPQLRQYESGSFIDIRKMGSHDS